MQVALSKEFFFSFYGQSQLGRPLQRGIYHRDGCTMDRTPPERFYSRELVAGGGG